MARRMHGRDAMVFLVFGHTAEAPPLRIGPLPSFRISGACIQDHRGEALAKHNGARWVVQGRDFYRMDCEGPVTVKLEGTEAAAHQLGPFAHFSLFNGTAYASRDVFAHYSEHENAWFLHGNETRCEGLLIQPV
jgi:hypothetical protein